MRERYKLTAVLKSSQSASMLKLKLTTVELQA